jgi:hypothetical protein
MKQVRSGFRSYRMLLMLYGEILGSTFGFGMGPRLGTIDGLVYNFIAGVKG